MRLRNLLGITFMALALTVISCDGTAQEETQTTVQSEAQKKVETATTQQTQGDIETARKLAQEIENTEESIENSRSEALDKLNSIGEASDTLSSQAIDEAKKMQARQQADAEKQREATVKERLNGTRE